MKRKLLSFSAFVASLFIAGDLISQQVIVQDATGAPSRVVTQTEIANSGSGSANSNSNARQSSFAMVGCPVITCPGNVTAYSDSTSCGTVVTFPAPTATDPCSINTVSFSYTGSIVTWTVPAGVTSIHIESRGAQGGNGGSSPIAPGLGAIISGDFAVTPGQQLKILVGQNNNAGNGGGGGTFVTDISNNPMCIAGGGGGGSEAIDSPNKHGLVGTTGGTGAGGGGTGGINGNGGNAGAAFNSGAGGGLLTNGANGWTANTGGQAFVNGGAGGNVGFGVGGFGGGGNGSGYVVGGGGGGYSGGGGGSNSTGTGGVGGGGGSYNGGINQVNTSGANTGNGLVIITYSGGGSLTISQLAGLPSGSVFPLGTTLQTFVVTDGLGGSDTCSFNVTVVDTIAPVLASQSNIVVNADSGMCAALVVFNSPFVTDNCSIAGITQTAGPASGSLFPVGTTTITFTAADSSGNISTTSFNVIVVDAESPVITCPSTITVNADSGMCSAVVNYSAPTATDNCNVASNTMTSGMASGSTFPVGTTTITYTAMDSSGNSTTCSFDVVVIDSEAPVMVCQNTINVASDSGVCTAVITFSAPAATDNCSAVSVVQTSGPASGSAFPTGTTTISFTATDSAGNTTVCSFDIVVSDTEAPIVNCGTNITTCAGEEAMITASATDLCSGIASLDYVLTGATTGSGSGTGLITFNAGTTTVTYTATDSSGNTSTCSFTVLATAAPNVTVSASASTVCVNDGVVTLTGSPAGGVWSGTGVTGSTFNPATAGNGSHVVTYTYVDSAGCTATGTLTIVVNPCSGMEENNGLAAMQVSPNPTTGSINIALGTLYSEVEITLVQVNGQIVQSEKYSDATSVNVDLSNVASGIYFLTVKADDEMRIVKVVRE